jgi:PIN domain nuclease of toxin-antitoxin system
MTAVLLDTHALIWWTTEDRLLGPRARKIIEDPDNRVAVSAISAMEISTKYRLGKLDIGERLAFSFVEDVEAEGFELLAVTAIHGQLAGKLGIPHNDPWDRLLIAQAQIEELILISNEKRFDEFGVSRLW